METSSYPVSKVAVVLGKKNSVIAKAAFSTLILKLQAKNIILIIYFQNSTIT